jgi:hypothetical protein
MTSPQQRMVRMRKSFNKNKSVLTEDYKFFTAPDVKPRVSIPQNKVAHKLAERSVPRSPKRS